MQNSSTSSVRPGTARRLTAKGQATRGRIVHAAAMLMFERGIAGTGIEDIQQQAGVSASQLYHYFADKRDLAHAVAQYQGVRVLEQQQPLLGHLDSFAALEQWREMLVKIQRQRGCRGGCPIGSLASELAETDDIARELLAKSFAGWQEHLRAGLAAMRAQGVLRKEADTDALAVFLLAAVQGGLLLTQTSRDTAPLETAMNNAIAYLQTFSVDEPGPRVVSARGRVSRPAAR